MRVLNSTETAPPPAHPFLFSTMSKSTALASEPPLIRARYFQVNRLSEKPDWLDLAPSHRCRSRQKACCLTHSAKVPRIGGGHPRRGSRTPNI